jgi:hypothetical protein
MGLWTFPSILTATTTTMATDFMMKAGGTLRVVKVATALFIAATALCVFYSGSEDHESGMQRKSFPRTFPKVRRGTKSTFTLSRALEGKMKVVHSSFVSNILILIMVFVLSICSCNFTCMLISALKGSL